MNITGKSLKTLLILVGLISVSGVLRVLFLDEYGFDNVSSIYLIVLGILLILEIDRMLVQCDTKRNLLICTGWILVVLVIRGARYSIFRDQDQLMRYLWYIYYVPLLVIPYYSLRASISVGTTDGNVKMGRSLRAFGGISIFLIILVLTNDYHQLVFHLHEGFRDYWRDEYTYGPLYWMVFVWMYILLFDSFGVLIYKCRISAFRKYLWIPVIPIAVGTIWNVLIATFLAPQINNIQPIEFPETFAFMIGGTWLCCIQIGLIPANQSYEKLFNLSNVGALITDKDGTVVYHSQNSTNPEEVSPNLLIRREAIHGGYVYWQSDVSEINRINEELESIHQQLNEEAELIVLENKLREKNASIEAKNNLYDAIAVRVLSQSKRIANLSALTKDSLNNTSTSQELIQNNLRIICVYGSYIKRMANFMIIAQQNNLVSQMELALAIAETLRQLEKMGIHTAINTEAEYQRRSALDLADVYEAFINCIEQSIQGVAGIYVTLGQNVCKLTIEGALPDEYAVPEGTRVECDDEIRFVSIPIRGKEENV